MLASCCIFCNNWDLDKILQIDKKYILLWCQGEFVEGMTTLIAQAVSSPIKFCKSWLDDAMGSAKSPPASHHTVRCKPPPRIRGKSQASRFEVLFSFYSLEIAVMQYWTFSRVLLLTPTVILILRILISVFPYLSFMLVLSKAAHVCGVILFPHTLGVFWPKVAQGITNIRHD